MRCTRFWMVTGLFLITSSAAWSTDQNGRWGIGGALQGAKAIGNSAVKDQASGLGILGGGAIRYGITSNWLAGVAYDYMNLGHGVTLDSILVQGIYMVDPNSPWTPIFTAGIGAAAQNIDHHYDNLAFKLGAGFEHSFNQALSAGPQLTYHYSSTSGNGIETVHVIGLGVVAWFSFDNLGPLPPLEPEPSAKAAPPAATPPPAPPQTIVVSVDPVHATLLPNETKSFQAIVQGTDNEGVEWTIDPHVGEISALGLYRSPKVIEKNQDVTVSARSKADTSKVGNATVHLKTPPLKADEKVTIEMNVLFDTGKADIKPQYATEIKKVADFMLLYGDTKAEIEGHTDSIGSVQHNVTLSQRRADSVRRYLIAKFNIPATRLKAKGYGPHKPIADNKTLEGRSRNRRVVATLSVILKSK